MKRCPHSTAEQSGVQQRGEQGRGDENKSSSAAGLSKPPYDAVEDKREGIQRTRADMGVHRATVPPSHSSLSVTIGPPPPLSSPPYSLPLPVFPAPSLSWTP